MFVNLNYPGSAWLAKVLQQRLKSPSSHPTPPSSSNSSTHTSATVHTEGKSKVQMESSIVPPPLSVSDSNSIISVEEYQKPGLVSNSPIPQFVAESCSSKMHSESVASQRGTSPSSSAVSTVVSSTMSNLLPVISVHPHPSSSSSLSIPSSVSSTSGVVCSTSTDSFSSHSPSAVMVSENSSGIAAVEEHADTSGGLTTLVPKGTRCLTLVSSVDGLSSPPSSQYEGNNVQSVSMAPPNTPSFSDCESSRNSMDGLTLVKQSSSQNLSQSRESLHSLSTEGEMETAEHVTDITENKPPRHSDVAGAYETATASASVFSDSSYSEFDVQAQSLATRPKRTKSADARRSDTRYSTGLAGLLFAKHKKAFWWQFYCPWHFKISQHMDNAAYRNTMVNVCSLCSFHLVKLL